MLHFIFETICLVNFIKKFTLFIKLVPYVMLHHFAKSFFKDNAKGVNKCMNYAFLKNDKIRQMARGKLREKTIRKSYIHTDTIIIYTAVREYTDQLKKLFIPSYGLLNKHP